MRLQVWRSYFLLYYLALTYSVAFLLVMTLAVPLWLHILIGALCLFSMLIDLWRYGWLGNKRVVMQIHIDEDRLWHCVTAEEERVYQAKSCVLWPYCLLIRLQLVNTKKSHTLLLMRDALLAQHFRQLRVWLSDPASWVK